MIESCTARLGSSLVVLRALLFAFKACGYTMRLSKRVGFVWKFGFCLQDPPLNLVRLESVTLGHASPRPLCRPLLEPQITTEPYSSIITSTIIESSRWAAVMLSQAPYSYL